VEGPFVFGVVAMTRLDCLRRKVCWAKPNHAFSMCQQFRKVIFVRSSPALALAHRLHATRAMLSSASRLPGVRRLFSKRRKKCGLLLFACRGRCERACCVRSFDLFARRLPVSKHSSRGGRAATPLFANARVRMHGFAQTFLHRDDVSSVQSHWNEASLGVFARRRTAGEAVASVARRARILKSLALTACPAMGAGTNAREPTERQSLPLSRTSIPHRQRARGPHFKTRTANRPHWAAGSEHR
jgi:hypothetical protein